MAAIVPPVPNRTPMFDADGNLDHSWLLFFQAISAASNSNTANMAAVMTGTVPGGIGAPGQISIAGVSVPLDVIDAAGRPAKRIAVTVAGPMTGAAPLGVHFWLDAPDTAGSDYLADGTQPADGTLGAAGPFSPKYLGFFPWAGSATQDYPFEIPAPDAAQYDRIYASSGSASVIPVPVQHLKTGETPSYQFLVDVTNTASGTEYAPNVTDLSFSTDLPSTWTSNPNIAILDSGDQAWQEIVNFVWPTMDPGYSKLGGINGELEFNGSRVYLGNLASTRDPIWENLAAQPVLPGSTVYTLYLISYDVDGNSNSIVPGVTPSISFTITRKAGAAGSERTKLPTNVNWSIGSFNQGDGTREIDLVVTGTDPVNDPTFGGYKLFYQRPGDAAPIEIRPPSQGRTLPLEWIGGNPPSAQSWTFSLVSIDTNNHANTIVVGVTPQFTATVGGGSLLNISQATPGTFSGTHFQIVGGSFNVKPGGINTTEITDAAITTPKLTTGQLDIGNAGVGKPIRLRIFDALNAAIAWIGDDTGFSGFVGAWFKQLYIGGTGPTTAPIKADASGNVTINGAALTFVSATATNTIDSNNITVVKTSSGAQCRIDGASYNAQNSGATLGLSASASSLQLTNTVAGSLSQAQLVCGVGNDPAMSLTSSAGTLYFEARVSNGVAATASAGIGTLPANTAGYLVVTINGATKKIPYYNV